jgi:hypothetical protein
VTAGLWRVGSHYGIHVYEGDRPVATFHTAEDARRCVEAMAALARIEAAHDQARAALNLYYNGLPSTSSWDWRM